MTDTISTTPGAKMIFMIRRREDASRDEMIAHWYKNHMPGVIEAQEAAIAAGRRPARKYLVTLFNGEQGEYTARPTYDGMAQLWFDKPLPKPDGPMFTEPRDTFDQKVEPFVPWATTEHVVIDGSDDLPVVPLTLNEPFPTTRSNLYKVTFLVKAKAGVDWSEFFGVWLEAHAPNVRETMNKIGGLRYVVSHSMNPDDEPYAGMAELYFSDPSGWERYGETITPDAFGPMVDRESLTWFGSDTQLIGIP